MSKHAQTRGFWEKFQESCSKTDFCRPLDSRGKHINKDTCPSGARNKASREHRQPNVEWGKWQFNAKKSDANRQHRKTETTTTNSPFAATLNKHLWTVDLGEEYQNVTPFFKSFQVDYVNKIIVLEIYETVNDDTWNWLWWLADVRDNKSESSLDHKIHDATGRSLATTTYKFLKAVSHQIVYDYGDTGIAINRIVLEYEGRSRIDHKSGDLD